ncbi:hypothetical protein [Alcanivorax sp. 1008]|uniref:hypothetical protein n=1 Tax=Alcanivorax sp. 1008 TaxID=2816853 RepID=UPI001D33240C|nr:hypothetical protein [Alcanivorax sp. 1008]MCC1498334.1 hypothetical protein [Alcanivorax sp. 1008]
MNKVINVFLIFLLMSSKCFAEWRPEPKFDIEGASYIETLTFISGFSYALSYYISYSNSAGKIMKSICIEPRHITSQLLIDLANRNFSGSISSEEFSAYIVEAMSIEYSCDVE